MVLPKALHRAQARLVGKALATDTQPQPLLHNPNKSRQCFPITEDGALKWLGYGLEDATSDWCDDESIVILCDGLLKDHEGPQYAQAYLLGIGIGRDLAGR